MTGQGLNQAVATLAYLGSKAVVTTEVVRDGIKK
jgi:hypothetical protein